MGCTQAQTFNIDKDMPPYLVPSQQARPTQETA